MTGECVHNTCQELIETMQMNCCDAISIPEAGKPHREGSR